ncbi:MAG: hypothetical protein AAGD34_04605 [Pseudomonadota bacterium]
MQSSFFQNRQPALSIKHNFIDVLDGEYASFISKTIQICDQTAAPRRPIGVKYAQRAFILQLVCAFHLCYLKSKAGDFSMYEWTEDDNGRPTNHLVGNNEKEIHAPQFELRVEQDRAVDRELEAAIEYKIAVSGVTGAADILELISSAVKRHAI